MKELIKKKTPVWLNKTLRILLIAFYKVTLFYRRFEAIISHIYIKEPNKNEVIDVVFILIHHSVWKLDAVYKLFKLDSRFNPVIVICPSKNGFDKDYITRELDIGYEFFHKKGFNVIKSFNGESWVDINKDFTNKVMFFTNPHNITKQNYQWNNFKSTLKFYVPYHHQIDGGQWDSQWKSPFHLSMTSLFYIDEFHKNVARNITLNKGHNVVVTGYPAVEPFYCKSYNCTDVWKKQKHRKKRIIFSPHHTIDFSNDTGVCEFLNIANEMMEIAMKYENEIQIAFKPHPILKVKLLNHPEWGKKRTLNYYKFWEESINTQLEEGGYEDLFLTSDAMIHDSGSFLAEYLYVNKPVMYLYNETTKSRFNDYGLLCLDCCHVDISNNVDIFIYNLITDTDKNKKARENFINERLLPDEDILPSKKIYNHVVNKVFNL